MSRLRKLREERKFTQVKMQMLTGIDQSDYSKIEHGKRNMSFEQCRRIALALGTSMDYLAGLTDDLTPYLCPVSRKRKMRRTCVQIGGSVLFADFMQGRGSVPVRPSEIWRFRENGRGQSPAPTKLQTQAKIADDRMCGWALSPNWSET